MNEQSERYLRDLEYLLNAFDPTMGKRKRGAPHNGLKNRIYDTINRLGVGKSYVTKWEKAKYPNDSVGISDGSLFKSREQLFFIVERLRSVEDILSDSEWEATDRFAIKIAQKRRDRCEEFLIDPGIPGHDIWEDKPLKSRYQDEYASKNLTGCAWNVYYLLYPSFKEPQEPFLAKALMKIMEHDKVHVYNIGESGEGEFRDGNYEFEDSIVQFDLSNESWNVHLKVKLTRRKQKIALGMYCISIDKQIFMGRVLLERINPENSIPNNKIYSFFKNERDYAMIDPRIQNFFSARRNNFLPLRPDVRTLKHLESAYARWHQNSRFLDPSLPNILIGFPISANENYNESIYDDILKFLNNRYSQYYNIDLMPLNNHQIKSYQGYLDDDMRLLKKCRIFLYFSDGAGKLSYGQIQLGFAIAFAKNVAIIGNEGEWSETIKNIKHRSLERIPTSQSLKEAWNSRFNSLKNDVSMYISDVYEKTLTAHK